MLGRIIVPLDGSELAERALPHAEALARLTGAQVLPARAVQRSTVPAIERVHAETERVLEARKYLDDVAYELPIHEIPNERGVAELVPPDMDTADWILEQVRSRGGDLIAMSTSGRSGLGRLILGSTAEKVLARTPVPVLLVRAWEPEPAPIGAHPTLLVPLDGSPFAEEALRPATALVAPIGGRLVLLHAAPTRTTALTLPKEIRVPPPDSEDESGHDIEKYLESIVGDLGAEGTVAEVEIRSGDAVEAIVAAACEHGANLIVMATRGRTGVSLAILGSVADGMLRRGAVPLLLVRPPIDEGDRNDPAGPAPRDAGD